MKNIKFLALLPLLALSSCGLGTKLSDEKAQERIDAIKEKAATLADDENYQNYKMAAVSNSYMYNDDDEKVDFKVSYKLNRNADGEFYAYIEMNEGKEKTTFDLYYAFDDEYEEVLYLKSYDSEAEDEKTQINVVVKKDNSSFDALYAQYLSEVSSTGAGFAAYSDPSTIAAQFDEDDPNYDVSVSYYSGINGDFSVKGVAKITDEAAEAVGEDSEYMTPKTTTVIATYSKDVFASYSSETVMLNGDKASGSGSISYQKSFLKISLPSGWQNELDKEAE